MGASGSRVHGDSWVYMSTTISSHSQIRDSQCLAVRSEQIISREFDASDRGFIRMFQLKERAIASDIEQFDHAIVTPHRHLHAVVTEANITCLRVKDLHTLQTVAGSRVVALHLSVQVPHSEHLMHRSEDNFAQLLAVRRNGSHERSLLQVQPVYLGTASHGIQLAALLRLTWKTNQTR